MPDPILHVHGNSAANDAVLFLYFSVATQVGLIIAHMSIYGNNH